MSSGDLAMHRRLDLRGAVLAAVGAPHSHAPTLRKCLAQGLVCHREQIGYDATGVKVIRHENRDRLYFPHA
jgi:hypothetical protein